MLRTVERFQWTRATLVLFEPPMPSSVTARQTLEMVEALARGEPNRGRIALTLFRGKVRDFKGH